jgi:hypothetical protein
MWVPAFSRLDVPSNTGALTALMTPVQQTPQLFTLLLVLGVLASFVVFLVIAYRVIRGHGSSALRLLARWALGVLVYLVMSVAVSLARPARIIEQGQDWCFDDWCIAVEAVHRIPSRTGPDVTVTTDLRIYNDARRAEGVQGFWAYVRDADDHRYAPLPGAWKEAVVAQVPPHESARTSMTFVVPGNASGLGFVTNHGGAGTCAVVPRLLEIGQGGCLFHTPNMIRLD